MTALPRGPVMLDVAGVELTGAERERLAHPLVGGVILFTRNYATPGQLRALTAAIRALRDPPLIIGVDHEGGRVQRFRDGFTQLPPMRAARRALGSRLRAAAAAAERIGGAGIAGELSAHGIDFSFTPVLDLDYGRSAVIGNRALHRNPNAVAHLASALCRGLRGGGMAAVGKHFPGHGFVARRLARRTARRRAAAGRAGAGTTWFRSARWCASASRPSCRPTSSIRRSTPCPPASRASGFDDVLRRRLGFDGLIFSDDLSMAGAQGPAAISWRRAEAAAAAGCDMVLVCNDPDAADELLARWRPAAQPDLARREARMAHRAVDGEDNPQPARTSRQAAAAR